MGYADTLTLSTLKQASRPCYTPAIPALWLCHLRQRKCWRIKLSMSQVGWKGVRWAMGHIDSRFIWRIGCKALPPYLGCRL
jgi:hypothetical protein|tara:strand:+ start:671 stop:913 length:243 start_codon:yes stop_codon:yes gene_type:complete